MLDLSFRKPDVLNPDGCDFLRHQDPTGSQGGRGDYPSFLFHAIVLIIRSNALDHPWVITRSQFRMN
jgi:hypothetical protein